MYFKILLILAFVAAAFAAPQFGMGQGGFGQRTEHMRGLGNQQQHGVGTFSAQQLSGTGVRGESSGSIGQQRGGFRQEHQQRSSGPQSHYGG